MLKWDKQRYLNDRRSSFHIHSEAHSRIQLLEIPHKIDPVPYPIEHGELIIQVFRALLNLIVDQKFFLLKEHDQILIEAGESFILNSLPENPPGVVQMIWLPGPNPCEICKP